MIDVIMELTDRIRQLETHKNFIMPDGKGMAQIRKARGINMRELAAMSKTSISLISRLESGKDVGFLAVQRIYDTLKELQKQNQEDAK